MLTSHLSRRERTIFILTILIVGGSTLFRFGVKRGIEFWRELCQEVEYKRMESVKLANLLQMEERIEQEYQQLAGKLQREGDDEEEVASLLAEIEALTRKTGLNVRTMRPQPSGKENFYRRYLIQMETEGDLEMLGKFLYYLPSLSRVTTVQRLQVNAQSSGPSLKYHFLIGRLLPQRRDNSFPAGEKQKRLGNESVVNNQLVAEQSESLASYRRLLTSRTLFKPSLRPAVPTVVSIGIKALLQKLTLIGIVSDGKTYQALINDKKTEEVGTYSVGDTVAEFVIEAIFGNKVILSYGTERVELSI